MGHMITAMTTQLCHCAMKADTDTIGMSILCSNKTLCIKSVTRGLKLTDLF